MYIHTIDLLRGIAALMVVLVHFFGTGFLENSVITKISSYGQHGVIIFFVISGFIIPYALSKKNYSLKNFNEFIIRRLARLNPPYYTSVFLTVSLYYLFPQNEQPLFSLSKMFLHLTYLVPFSGEIWYNNVYWTLAIELQYYLIIGLLYP
ncbi:MAG: acyltransferase, partial [Rhizonema sp. PD38]|nr:acyltransferase [Rhizonema sp. PD38]